MKRLHSLLCLSSLAIFSFACAPQETEEEMLERTAVDLRLPIPATDPKYLDFIGAEIIVKPGEDKMTCKHASLEGEDLVFDVADSKQSKFGHHFVLVRAKNPLPPGTVEDCSKPEDMAKFDVLTIPDFELSPGQGFFIPKGTSIVMQSHYVNTGKDAIRVRDTLRFRRIDPSTVKTWAAAFTTYLLSHQIKSGEQSTRSYECTIPRDYKAIMLGGHMHEWGKKFLLQYRVAPTDTMKELYRVDDWHAHYRDEPPTNLMRENPLDLPKGTVFRTECTWFNDTPETISFPKEMCATFGILLGQKEPWPCILE